MGEAAPAAATVASELRTESGRICATWIVARKAASSSAVGRCPRRSRCQTSSIEQVRARSTASYCR